MPTEKDAFYIFILSSQHTINYSIFSTHEHSKRARLAARKAAK
jgi:hypothetical protein